MIKWDNESHLEVIEQLAELEGMICSEEELSEAFDEMIKECYHYPEKFTPTDIRTFFNDWSDGLCKDGRIHEEQYETYCYVGGYES